MSTIEQLWRYPVKSLQGEQITSTEVEDVVLGDRAWGILDSETGKLLSAKRIPKLLEGSAKLVDDGCVLTFDDKEVHNNDPNINGDLSSWLNREVRLASPKLGEQATIEIEWDEGLDEVPDDPEIFEFSTSPGWFFDSSSSLHLIGSGTLSMLDARIGDGAGDVRRFRPNIVVATPEAFVEDDWVGKELLLGSVRAAVKKRTDRCIVITRAFGEYEASRKTLKYLSKNHQREAGLSLEPTQSGHMTVGDSVEISSD
ncbi:MAG: MOSC N-terminal beta barrel domain-containing protein [Acidimicrobiales bacterium]|nr:MOSC N-terminal beta barrel domain-containing protein [Acidimicrobiales bacterium]